MKILFWTVATDLFRKWSIWWRKNNAERELGSAGWRWSVFNRMVREDLFWGDAIYAKNYRGGGAASCMPLWGESISEGNTASVKAAGRQGVPGVFQEEQGEEGVGAMVDTSDFWGHITSAFPSCQVTLPDASIYLGYRMSRMQSLWAQCSVAHRQSSVGGQHSGCLRTCCRHLEAACSGWGAVCGKGLISRFSPLVLVTVLVGEGCSEFREGLALLTLSLSLFFPSSSQTCPLS